MPVILCICVAFCCVLLCLFITLVLHYLADGNHSTVVGHVLTEVVTVPQVDNNAVSGQFLTEYAAFENENSLTDQLVLSGQPYGGTRYIITVDQFIRLRYESDVGRASRFYYEASPEPVCAMSNR